MSSGSHIRLQAVTLCEISQSAAMVQHKSRNLWEDPCHTSVAAGEECGHGQAVLAMHGKKMQPGACSVMLRSNLPAKYSACTTLKHASMYWRIFLAGTGAGQTPAHCWAILAFYLLLVLTQGTTRVVPCSGSEHWKKILAVTTLQSHDFQMIWDPALQLQCGPSPYGLILQHASSVPDLAHVVPCSDPLCLAA